MAKSIVVEAQEIFNKAIKPQDGRGRGLTTSQLRKFLNEVVRISNEVEVFKAQQLRKEKTITPWESIQREIEFLDIKLMYQAARESTVERFYTQGHISDLIKTAKESPGTYERFADLIEAIVAIHRYNGGKE